MNDQNTTPDAETHPYDDDVRTFLDLTERIEKLTAEREAVKQRFRALGVGNHPSVNGITVQVTAPPRSFSLEKGWKLLTAEQQAVCMSPDAKKVRAQLPPVLLDSCMDEGTGEPRVTVK